MNLRAGGAQLLREPIVHFLFAGALIFLLFAGSSTDVRDREIVVGEAQVARLVSGWSDTWHRVPTAEELDGLIRDYVKEEVYYREAIRLGLDEDDPLVRRRLRSKMEYLSTSEIETETPNEATLQNWLNRNAARYVADASYDFDQIYIGEDAGLANELLAKLGAGASPDAMGKAISLPPSLSNATNAEIIRQFGEDFARGLATVPLATWSGPVASGFGYHLLRVRKVEVPKPPKLADVRQRVENDWRAATRADREARAYQALLDDYDIRIDRPK